MTDWPALLLETVRGRPLPQLAGMALCVLLLGMSKGGFPIQSVSLPLLILLWPDQLEPARQSVSFLLPLLCAMDVVAFLFYRRHVRWDRIRPVIPATLAGVLLAGILFRSGTAAQIAFSDRLLQGFVGLLGLAFVAYHLLRKRLFARLGREPGFRPGWRFSAAAGLGCGITSTLAHAAGPVSQMYFLPQQLPKLQLAGTLCGFFFGLNAVKLVPFALQGRFTPESLSLGLLMLPVAPVGVGLGYVLVRLLREQAYVRIILSLLGVTSLLLAGRAVGLL